MKIICSKTSLLKGVNTVLKAVPSKTTMPILECILIDATLGKIKFTANDMELGIETIVEGEILEKGIVAIDAKVFSEIHQDVQSYLQGYASHYLHPPRQLLHRQSCNTAPGGIPVHIPGRSLPLSSSWSDPCALFFRQNAPSASAL